MTEKNRYVCVHAHFYQPPRENPWLEAIEVQDSAYPYHDWNERITAECYAPNLAARILDGKGRIQEMINNYSKISFNFGPTLLSWLQRKAPHVYEAIREADRESAKRFSGHGSAMAQAYNHMILPLASCRDKETQVHWGIMDFIRHFGRRPEGMWLPETAVDTETLETLAAQDVLFTVLAPHQAGRVRKFGEKTWQNVLGQKIDPTMAYRVQLPSGKSMALFFYDGPISRAVAFEKLLNSGEQFARRLLEGFSSDRSWPQLLHIATDGETYGHHHPYGDMALSYALHYIESNELARLTNYGEYLEKHPPTHEVEIVENSSWSCAHGIERWRSDCGCASGMNPGWNQKWRAPLRKALDWLRDAITDPWEERAGALLKDPWAARNDYISLIHDRSKAAVEEFIKRHASRPLDRDGRIVLLRLMEAQRHAQLMYTSCGWFFDDLSGIETVQIIQYAGRALQLAMETIGGNLEPKFISLLDKAQSNLPSQGTGGKIYLERVKKPRLDLRKLGAHYAMSSLFDDYPEETKIYCYFAKRRGMRILEAGRAKLLLGHAEFQSLITEKGSELSFGAFHLGDHNISCGVQVFRGESIHKSCCEEIAEAFLGGDYAETIRRIDRHFGGQSYSLKTLFRDEQRKILDMVLAPTLEEAEASYRHLFETHGPLMTFLQETSVPLPRAFSAAAEFVLNAGLQRAFSGDELDAEDALKLLKEARRTGVSLDAQTLEFTLRRCIERMARRFRENPLDIHLLEELDAAVAMTAVLPFTVNLWPVENQFYEVLKAAYPRAAKKGRAAENKAWLDLFKKLGERLKILVPGETAV